MGRNILAVVAGLFAGVIGIFLIEGVGHAVYPPPAGMDFNNPEQLREMMANMPVGALLMVAVAWAMGSFAGGVVAALIAMKSKITMSLIVGGLLMVAGIANMLMIPHPAWFWIVGLAVYLPFAYLGGKIASKLAVQAPPSIGT